MQIRVISAEEAAEWRRAQSKIDPKEAAKKARAAIRKSETWRGYVEEARNNQAHASNVRANFLVEAHDYGMTWDEIAAAVHMHPVAVRRLVSRRRSRDSASEPEPIETFPLEWNLSPEQQD